MNKIIIGSRESTLAVMQTKLVMEEIKRCNPNLDLELKTFKTTGDKILDRPLDLVGGKGLFVKELDQALLSGEIDLAVHSLKDVPMEINEELPILAVTKRGDPRDVLVLPQGQTELDSSANIVIGSSSFRRKLQIQALFPNAVIKPIRGNIQTRIKKLDEGEFDAIILAAAGLYRAELGHRISRTFSIDEVLPAAGQAVLAIQGRKDYDCSFLQSVCDQDTWIAATCERAFVTALNGGCSSPVAAYATVENRCISLIGLYYNESTKEYVIEHTSGPCEKAELLGHEFALQMKNKYC